MIILVAEDEALIALELQFALQAAGHKVLGPAPDIATALCLTNKGLPQLALIDIHLRDRDDGTRLARLLKSKWDIPCLFLSGQVNEARAARDAALGMVGKPFSPSEVVEILKGRQPSRLPGRFELFDG